MIVAADDIEVAGGEAIPRAGGCIGYATWGGCAHRVQQSMAPEFVPA